MKYIYFELHWRVTNSEDKIIHNMNILQIKPHTNSHGIWSHRSICPDVEPTYSGDGDKVIDQFWIDIDKLNMSLEKGYQPYVRDVMDKLKALVRDQNITEIVDRNE